MLLFVLNAFVRSARRPPQPEEKGLSGTLLIHSTTDEFTPFEQSVKIFANSDQSHTRLILTQYGAPHAQSWGTDRVAYTGYIDEFLATYVPGFGTARTTPPEN